MISAPIIAGGAASTIATTPGELTARNIYTGAPIIEAATLAVIIGPPTNLQTTNITSTSARFSWSAPA